MTASTSSSRGGSKAALRAWFTKRLRDHVRDARRGFLPFVSGLAGVIWWLVRLAIVLLLLGVCALIIDAAVTVLQESGISKLDRVLTVMDLLLTSVMATVGLHAIQRLFGGRGIYRRSRRPPRR